MKAFTRKELEEKLGLRNEEIKLVMKYQKQFPELLQDDTRLNLRDLVTKLGINMTQWARWYKKNVEENEFFLEEEDWWVLDTMSTTEKGGQVAKNFLVSVEFAKNICMMAKTKLSQEVRSYFILMENTVHKMVEWDMIRHPEKQSYKIMCEELRLYLLRNLDKEAKFYDYSNEADALNMICLGARAKQIREYIEAQDKQTREHLTIEYNTYLYKMQELNIMFLRMNFEKEKRYEMIKQGFNVTYPNAISFVVANTDK